MRLEVENKATIYIFICKFSRIMHPIQAILDKCLSGLLSSTYKFYLSGFKADTQAILAFFIIM